MIRRLRNLRQSGTLLEYVESFSNLMHQMLAHNPNIDHEIFLTTFVDGLKDDIKSVVMIQQPHDLETVVSLALLQEEIEEDNPRSNIKQHMSKPMLQQNFSPTG